MKNSPTTRLSRSLLLLLCFLLTWPPSLRGVEDPLTDPLEVKALREIRESIVDAYGNLHNWDKGNPCTSNLTGVVCFNETLLDGYLHVRELRMLSLNLSGTLSPSLGKLSHLEILDFMWNNISGSIPQEIGDIKSLQLLLLNGNQLSGILPDYLGYLPKLERIQIDENKISGPIPTSFANLNATRHFHMNNNSLSGQIPHELSKLPNLIHMLLDNNNLSGILPPELSRLPRLLILQLDNNKFEGSTIPSSFANMTKLVKLSLRNCSLEGPIPDLSEIPNLSYIDLSSNQLTGAIPSGKLSDNITTILFSENKLSGPIPVGFSELPHLQKLSVAGNSLNGSIPSRIWENRVLNQSESLDLNFENNSFSGISGNTFLPSNVTIRMKGNPACLNITLANYCEPLGEHVNNEIGDRYEKSSSETCLTQSCPPPYEFSPFSPVPCFCAAPLVVDVRLKSPAFSDFVPYKTSFKHYLASGLGLHFYQLDFESLEWEPGPRLALDLKFFPAYNSGDESSGRFNSNEVRRILRTLADWDIDDDKFFGPYELLYFELSSVYRDVIMGITASNMHKGVLVGIILGAGVCGFLLTTICCLILWMRKNRFLMRLTKRQDSRTLAKMVGIKAFTYAELASATYGFTSSSEIGKGGYGRVYKGSLEDGTTVAIKRAEQTSLQGEREFLTEIEYMSRLHHKNLVPLIGYCDEQAEQMLVYQFMSNGSLRDNISGNSREPISFMTRLRVAIEAAKGILYLHFEADPPIFHRDIKSSNILLDSQFVAKVADFGLSRVAPDNNTSNGEVAYVSTVVRGTPGYMDPEYVLTHRYSDRSDVYSFGIVLLELLTGLKPLDRNQNLLQEVKAATRTGHVFSMMDKRMGPYLSYGAEKVLNVALNCCQDDVERRPSMADVVRILEDIWYKLSVNGENGWESGSGGREGASSSSSPSPMPLLYRSMEVSGSNLASGTILSIDPL